MTRQQMLLPLVRASDLVRQLARTRWVHFRTPTQDAFSGHRSLGVDAPI